MFEKKKTRDDILWSLHSAQLSELSAPFPLRQFPCIFFDVSD